MTVHEIAEKTGVSPRTVRFYDEIGLLRPCGATEAGYRLYDEAELEKLQQIRLFQFLGFSLEEIKGILLNPDFDRKRVVKCQKLLLELRKNQLEKLIAQIDLLEREGGEMSLQNFDLSETEWEWAWNEIYQTQGEVQRGILPTIPDAVELFRKNRAVKVLDLGCGTGRHAIYLAQNGFEVTATDISEKGVAVTKNKAKKLGLTVTTACHDMRAIPFKNETFDAVLCTWVTGHGTRADMERHAQEMLRVLKPGGILFVDYQSKADENYGRGVAIERDTFLENMPGEEKIPHHYTDEPELREIYQGQDLEIRPFTYSYAGPDGKEKKIEALIMACKKKEGEEACSSPSGSPARK